MKALTGGEDPVQQELGYLFATAQAIDTSVKLTASVTCVYY